MKSKQVGNIKLWVIVVPAIAGIIVAVIQFGPTWKPVVRDWLEDGGPTGKKLNYYIAYIILQPIPGAAPGQPVGCELLIQAATGI